MKSNISHERTTDNIRQQYSNHTTARHGATPPHDSIARPQTRTLSLPCSPHPTIISQATHGIRAARGTQGHKGIDTKHNAIPPTHRGDTETAQIDDAPVSISAPSAGPEGVVDAGELPPSTSPF